MLYGFTILLMLMDLLTKRLTEAKIKPDATIPVIPDWLSWKVIHNTGASFGLFTGHLFMIAVGSIMVILLVFYLYKKSETKGFIVQTYFALILGGALGNLVDRMTYGYVTDFIQFRFWPAIFNVADMEIRTGTILLLILLFSNKWNLKGRGFW